MNQILDFGEDKESGGINVIDKNNTQGVFTDEKNVNKIRNANLGSKIKKEKIKQPKSNANNEMGYGNVPNKSTKIVKIFAVLLLIMAIAILCIVRIYSIKKE